jgi:hypothetical protein
VVVVNNAIHGIAGLAVALAVVGVDRGGVRGLAVRLVREVCADKKGAMAGWCGHDSD